MRYGELPIAHLLPKFQQYMDVMDYMDKSCPGTRPECG